MKKYKVMEEIECPYIDEHKPVTWTRSICFKCRGKGTVLVKVDLEEALINILENNPSIILDTKPLIRTW